MFPFSRARRQTRRAGTPPAVARPSPLALETLEERVVPAVTYHGGALMSQVEVQALYYGADWSNNTTLYNQTGYLEGFLDSLVHGSYMDMLGKAGYGVGRGSFNAGRIALTHPDKGYYLTDDQIRSDLQAYISNGSLQAPDANRLYVIFVEPGVAVSHGKENSQNDFLGYHGAFAGRSPYGFATDVRYAVIAYPGGAVGNAGLSWLSAVGDLTEVTSHELAEAVTDPDVNYRTLGWYDDAQNAEVGDLTNARMVYLKGYAVQRIANVNDFAMTPAGSSSETQATFALLNGGALYEHTASGWTSLSSGIASISDQAIDNFGRSMIEVVTTSGDAYEYHDGGGWTYLWSGATSAKAGQGVSYVLFTNGTVWQYDDASRGWTYVYNNATAIDAGTDKAGVNMVDIVFNWGDAWEHSDSSGWHYLGSGVRSVSAGQQGISELVFNNGNGYFFNEATGGSVFLGSNVAFITSGVDASGNYMIDLVYNGGVGYEYRVGGGWSYLWSNIQSLTKGHAGLVDILFSWGDAYDHTAWGWSYLDNSILQTA